MLSSFVMNAEDKQARLGIDKESCYRTHAPKLERAGLLDLDGPTDYAALLVGVEYADFTWDNIVSLTQSRDMKIECGADGTVPLSGFAPPIVAQPQPGAATV